MPAKKSKTRKPAFEPFVFEMGIFPSDDGGFVIRYESEDDRAHEVCPAIVDAIAASLGLDTTEVWTGVTR